MGRCNGLCLCPILNEGTIPNWALRGGKFKKWGTVEDLGHVGMPSKAAVGI